MSDAIPRLRMFAGPNGSGKTTVKNELGKPESWFGLYINPDELEATIRNTGLLPLEPLGLTFKLSDVCSHFAKSPFLAKTGLNHTASAIHQTGNSLDFRGLTFTSYHASVLSDFLRRQALNASKSFSFETVMSASDKVDLLRDAQTRGYRTYLYFVATDSPTINIQRVRTRVAAGGHDVPEDKIVSSLCITLFEPKVSRSPRLSRPISVIVDDGDCPRTTGIGLPSISRGSGAVQICCPLICIRLKL